MDAEVEKSVMRHVLRDYSRGRTWVCACPICNEMRMDADGSARILAVCEKTRIPLGTTAVPPSKK